MSQTNMVVVEGRITKILQGKSEKAPSRVSIRNVDDWNGKMVARYVNWTVWPNCKGAENLKEGNTVKLIGRIEENSYEKDGKRIYVTDVTANSIELSDNELDMPMPEKKEAPAKVEVAEAPVVNDDDEIPF